MVQKVLERNNMTFISIPDKIVQEVGIRSGSYVEVTDDGYHIILTPVEEDFTDAEWKKLLSLKEEKGKVFKSGKAMIKHLRGSMKK